MKDTNPEIVVKLTKKHKIIIAIVMAIIVFCGLIGIYVPRFVKINKQLKQDSVATADNETNKQEDNLFQDSNSYAVKVINILSNSSSAYMGLKIYLNNNNTLDISKLNLNKDNFTKLEALASTIYNLLKDNIQNNKVSENIILENNQLITLTNEFCNMLFNLYKNK